MLVRLGVGASRPVATFAIATRDSTLSIPRRALGGPAWFTFSVAAAREGERDATAGGVDLAPAGGAFRYALTD